MDNIILESCWLVYLLVLFVLKVRVPTLTKILIKFFRLLLISEILEKLILFVMLKVRLIGWSLWYLRLLDWVVLNENLLLRNLVYLLTFPFVSFVYRYGLWHKLVRLLMRLRFLSLRLCCLSHLRWCSVFLYQRVNRLLLFIKNTLSLMPGWIIGWTHRVCLLSRYLVLNMHRCWGRRGRMRYWLIHRVRNSIWIVLTVSKVTLPSRWCFIANMRGNHAFRFI